MLENDAGYREKHFIYEVKQIDEFFERFNDDSASFIRKVYRDRHAAFTPTREKLIRSLFDYKDPHWDTSLISAFVVRATDPSAPALLNFYGDDWYAEARCLFQYKGSVVAIPLVLKIETNQRGARWVIVAVKSNPLKEEATGVQFSGNPAQRTRFIDPSSFGTNFSSDLDRAFGDKEHLWEYVDSAFFSRRNSAGFFDAIEKDRIKFIRVSTIDYHFLQVSPWIFTVSYFEREDLNSGWLIRSLVKDSTGSVDMYRKNLLEQ